MEIEVRDRADDVGELLTALAAHVTLGEPVLQDDQAYAPAGWTYGAARVGVPFGRLRTAGGRHLFTVRTPVDNELARTEQESPVADREAVHRAMLAMGFRATVRIVMDRRTGRCGPLSVCVDEVADAGTFLDIERLAGDGVDGASVQADPDMWATSLGVPPTGSSTPTTPWSAPPPRPSRTTPSHRGR